jgi:hypothetical protein
LKHLQANLAVHWAVLYKISGFKMIENRKKESKTIMSVYSYTILMPPIFYHLKTRYFVKNRPMHSQICLMSYLTLLKSFVFVHRKSKMATAAGQIKKVIHLRN